MIPKKVTIPFKYCSLKRASSFLSEVTERCIEVSDLQNLLRERIIKGCINFSDGTSIEADPLDGSSLRMDLTATIDIPDEYRILEEKGALIPCGLDEKMKVDFDKQMQDRLTEFLRTYTLGHDGKYFDGLLPWLWREDGTLSHTSPNPFNKPTWEIEYEAQDGYSIFSLVSPTGIWQISQDGFYQGIYDTLFSRGEFDSTADTPLVFRRVPETKYKWTGVVYGYKIKANQVILLDEDIKTLIELLCVPGSVEASYISPAIVRPLDMHEHQLKLHSTEESTFIKPKKSREPSRQMKDVVKALVTANPDLGEAAASEPYALHQKIEALLVQKKLPPIDVTPESIGGWISASSWGE